MRYSEDLIEKLRDSNDIVEIIGRHTILKSSGRSCMGLCPFPSHKEKSPSFSVSQDKQLYHCFGCGKSGNLYSFLRDYYGYSFVESIEYLAKRSGIPLPKASAGEQGRENNRKELKEILSVALDQFTNNLKSLSSDHKVIVYLKHRGFDENSIKHLKIGWAQDSWDKLTIDLQKRGLSLERASELGLVKKRTKGSGYYDGFRARVMFPVFSFSNEVVGFGGRVLGDEKPKYINSSESDVFKKGRIFYGQNWASPYIRQENETIVVEGYTDWISLFVAGVKNVLATMGTSLTEEHGKKIKTLCSKVLCLFDGDQAGKKASERALIHLFRSGLMVRGVFLDQGEDPDSFVKNRSLKDVRSTLNAASDLFLQLLDQRLTDFQARPDEKIETLNWSAQILSQIPYGSPLVSLYIQEIESRLFIDKNVIQSEIRKAQKEVQTQRKTQKEVQTQRKAQREVQTQRKAQREVQTQRKTQKEVQTQRKAQREVQTQRKAQREVQTQRETQRKTQKETQKKAQQSSNSQFSSPQQQSIKFNEKSSEKLNEEPSKSSEKLNEEPSKSPEKLNEEPLESPEKLNKEPSESPPSEPLPPEPLPSESLPPEPPPSESLPFEPLPPEPPPSESLPFEPPPFEPLPPESPPPEPIGQPRRRQVFLGYKKNNPEYVLFSLSLSDPKLFKEAINAELCFTDPGAQFLWGLANDRYGQDSQSFDRFKRVESYLANYCSNPEVLTLTMEEPYSRFDKEQKNEIFHECLHRVKNQKMNHESKRMSQKMGPTTDQEDLEHFMELQRKKRNL